LLSWNRARAGSQCVSQITAGDSILGRLTPPDWVCVRFETRCVTSRVKCTSRARRKVLHWRFQFLLSPVMNKAKPLSVVLADDHVIVREGFAAFCESQAGLAVAGQCGDGAAALEMIQTLRPDFAILDLNMPKMTGVQVAKKVKDMKCLTRVIILS